MQIKSPIEKIHLAGNAVEELDFRPHVENDREFFVQPYSICIGSTDFWVLILLSAEQGEITVEAAAPYLYSDGQHACLAIAALADERYFRGLRRKFALRVVWTDVQAFVRAPDGWPLGPADSSGAHYPLEWFENKRELLDRFIAWRNANGIFGVLKWFLPLIVEGTWLTMPNSSVKLCTVSWS